MQLVHFPDKLQCDNFIEENQYYRASKVVKKDPNLIHQFVRFSSNY